MMVFYVAKRDCGPAELLFTMLLKLVFPGANSESDFGSDANGLPGFIVDRELPLLLGR